MTHSLTLEFGRILTEIEWRDIAERARVLPYVQSLVANVIDGITNMPVPRCDTCKWWVRADRQLSEWACCERVTVTVEAPERKDALAVTTIDDQGNGDFSTHQSFGCVQHEAKE